MTPSIVMVGLDFRTAAIDIREQLALSGCALDAALEHLAGPRVTVDDPQPRRLDALEAVILSTCNRLEFYLVAADVSTATSAVLTYLDRGHGIPGDRIQSYLQVSAGGAAVEHLFRVASGLESMIIGEPQILGQVSRAYALAHAAGATGPILSHLFHAALRSGKRAHGETGIGECTVSLSHAAADLLADQLPSLSTSRVLIVGAGEMAVLAARAVRDHGVGHLAFANRTLAAAQELAARFGGTAHPWADLAGLLDWADAVISATGAPHVVITKDAVAAALATRGNRALLLLDLALPRDVDPAVQELAGVRCYDLDAMNATLALNRSRRLASVPAVEAIVAEERAAFDRWLAARAAAPTVAQLHQRAHTVAEREIARTLRRLDPADEHLAHEIELLTHRIVRKLLHEPTVRLKAQAAAGDGRLYRDAVAELFALDRSGS